MKLLCHFPAVGVSNTYVVGPESGGDAILVDPGRFDVSLLELIEGAGFYIRAVLVSHDHDNHIQGLNTLLKIYDAAIFAGNERIKDFPAIPAKGGTCIRAAGFEVEVIDIEGHSPDSRVFKVGSYLFTGDVLSAGRIGTSNTSEAGLRLTENISSRLLNLPGDTLVLPGHGPPTTISVERSLNPELSG